MKKARNGFIKTFPYLCLVGVIVLGLMTIVGTGGGGGGGGDGGAVLVSIEVTPTNPSIPKGNDQQFTATGTYDDNTTQDITTQVTWESSDNSVATVSNAAGSEGLSTSVDAGTATITATDPSTSISGTTDLTVTDAELLSIEVTPTDPSISLGNTQQFTATGTYTDSSTLDITDSVTWSSSDTGVATISNAAGSEGLSTSVDVGTATITATDPSTSISGTTDLTVAGYRTFYLTPPPDYDLTEVPPDITGSIQLFIYSSPAKLYQTAIVGDIQGSNYVFSFYLAVPGTHTLHAEIVLDPGAGETILAEKYFTVNSTTYTLFTDSVDGTDPIIPSGGTLALRLTGDSSGTGIGLLFANDHFPFIQVPPIDD